MGACLFGGLERRRWRGFSKIAAAAEATDSCYTKTHSDLLRLLSAMTGRAAGQLAFRYVPSRRNGNAAVAVNGESPARSRLERRTLSLVIRNFRITVRTSFGS